MMSDADALPVNTAAPQAMVLDLQAEVAGMAAANRAYEAVVQALRITIARLKKQRFGASSEKIEREIEQLELALESLETARAAADATPEPDTPEAADAPEAGTAAPDSVPPQRRRRPSPASPRTRPARPSCSTPASAALIVAARCGWSARVRRIRKRSSGPFP